MSPAVSAAGNGATPLRARAQANKRAAWLPREHGFWVMSCAIAISSLSSRPRWLASLVAVALIGSAALVGARLRRYVRRSAFLQLSAALLLAAFAIPVEVTAGRAPADAVLDAVAWSSVFAAFTCGVWACNARSSRLRRSRAGRLASLSVAAPACAALGFLFVASHARALAALLAATAMLAFAVWRPGAKQMKPVGLSLAACAAVVSIVLTFG
jgi:hypothetical protein